jgi:L-methionine (R)-S-oxide reductase
VAFNWSLALTTTVRALGADSGTIHLLADDGLLHLEAHTPNIPAAVVDQVRTVPVGKGMAGLAVARAAPVDACNLQTDTTGDVRPGARATGLQGAVVVPMLKNGIALGALGVANFHERTFTAAEIEDLLRRAEAMLA